MMIRDIVRQKIKLVKERTDKIHGKGTSERMLKLMEKFFDLVDENYKIRVDFSIPAEEKWKRMLDTKRKMNLVKYKINEGLIHLGVPILCWQNNVVSQALPAVLSFTNEATVC